MTSTTNTINDFYRGCLCDHVDSDNAAQEEQTVLCLGTCSSNILNSSDGTSKNGLDEPYLYETTSNPESQLRHNAIPGSSSALTDINKNEERIKSNVKKY